MHLSLLPGGNRIHPKEFKALQKLWYQKLNEDGFEEIENKDGYLKAFHSQDFVHPRLNSTQTLAKFEYWQLTKSFLHFYDSNFESERHREIWRLHSEGLPRRKISEELHSLYHFKISDSMIQVIVSALQKIMFEAKQNGDLHT